MFMPLSMGGEMITSNLHYLYIIYRRLFEHLKNIILNTDQQITHLKAEQDTVLKDFESFKENSEKDYENNIKINQKLINMYYIYIYIYYIVRKIYH